MSGPFHKTQFTFAGLELMTDWKVADQNAVKTLQTWYGTNPTGLYAWDAVDSVIAAEAGLSSDEVSLIQFIGGAWEALRDTLRWWNSANAITALIDYMLITKDDSYRSVVENTFSNGPNTWRLNNGALAGAAIAFAAGGPVGLGLIGFSLDNIKIYNGNFLDDYYDDDGWWALAWIKAYDLTGDQKYITQATTIFNEMKNGWDNVCCGGVYWQKDHADGSGKKTPYKNTIANELYLAVAVGLYIRGVDQGPADQLLISTAWNWFQSKFFINNEKPGLIHDALTTGDSKHSCQNDTGSAVWTYNQGVILGVLSDLFVAFKQTQYLDTAVNIADALINNLVVDNVKISGVKESSPGVFILTEFTDSTVGASVNYNQFKGIFIRNLGYLYKHRPLSRYRAFVLNNATWIMGNRDLSNHFGGNWSGPFDYADFVRQTAGIDLLNAANVVPPQINYTSLKQFLSDSGVSLPAHLSSILNGEKSLANVMMHNFL